MRGNGICGRVSVGSVCFQFYGVSILNMEQKVDKLGSLFHSEELRIFWLLRFKLKMLFSSPSRDGEVIWREWEEEPTVICIAQIGHRDVIEINNSRRPWTEPWGSLLFPAKVPSRFSQIGIWASWELYQRCPDQRAQTEGSAGLVC